MSEAPLAVVTGASSGIGAELAKLASRDGYEVLLVARRVDRLEALANSLPNKAHVLEADLGTPEGPALVSEVAAKIGQPVEVLVNNAGFGRNGPFLAGEAARDVAMVDLNVRAVVDLTHRFLPAMVERRRGGVLNVASLAAYQPGPNCAVYYATKAFVLSFSEALWCEVKGRGVRVSALCPGPVKTEFMEISGMDRALLQRFVRAVPLERVAADGWAGFTKGKRVILPGLTAKMSAMTSGLTPRAVVLPVVKALQSTVRKP